MSRLIYKLLLFLFVVAVVAIGSYNVNKWSFEKSGLQLCDSTEILMTGSSLFMLGLNPEFIPHSENIASAAEPVVISFFKLRDILANNHNVKKVVISCSLHEITEQDIVFSGKKPVVVEMFTRLSYLQKPVSLNDLRLFNVDYYSYWEVFVRNRIFPNYFFISRAFSEDNVRCNYEGLMYVSGFQTRGDFNIKAEVFEDIDIDKVASAHFPDKNMEAKLSVVSMNYIDSISSLCSKIDIDLIVVGMPIPDKLFKHIPQFYVSYYNSYIKELKSRDKLRFYDFMHTGEPDWFADLIHLNKYGAEKTSVMLNDSLNAGN